jgi:glycosyltransferase involved in cell wall biosynthesis
MTPDVSYLVSAYNRPDLLMCCLASLKAQTHSALAEIIVADNAVVEHYAEANYNVCRMMGVVYIQTTAKTCYHSAEMIAGIAQGRYLCFPSDDSYYVPLFQEILVAKADALDWELIYCEMLYNPRSPLDIHRVLGVQPKLNHIDKTGFLVRREVFTGFEAKDRTPAADGEMIEELVRRGVSHGKHHGTLAVHN